MYYLVTFERETSRYEEGQLEVTKNTQTIVMKEDENQPTFLRYYTEVKRALYKNGEGEGSPE